VSSLTEKQITNEHTANLVAVSIVHDAGMIYRWLTAGQLLFYSSLTSAKLSLLALYRDLLNRASPQFTIMWWVILAFCILVGCKKRSPQVYMSTDG
jgi:hypothetical protein